MIYEVVFTMEGNLKAREHLLWYYQRKKSQEDLCFALWYPSTGSGRLTAIIDEIILPKEGEHILHGNVSFSPDYLVRSIELACMKKAGLAFMHSHGSPGWQGMSDPDIKAERDIIAYPVKATGLPLVGLTIGTDGYWSARFWRQTKREMQCCDCHKVRVVEQQTYRVYFNNRLFPPPVRRKILKRTFDTWGVQSQSTIARLHIGIIGLGSVGCIVAESLARIGVERITLIDPDIVQEHNLDRLLYGTVTDINKSKVKLAARVMRRNATAAKIQVKAIPASIQNLSAYRAALDCDLLFSCVDRPVARDILNYIAHAHLIPVIDGGVAVEVDKMDRLFSAHWRTHVVTPYHQCLRCNGQYNSSMVVTELDGSLDNPNYIRNLPLEHQEGSQNVFPFSLSVAGMQVNLMLRYLLALDWWPLVKQQEYQFVIAETHIRNEDCHVNCAFRQRRARGDIENPQYLIEDSWGVWGWKSLKTWLLNLRK